MLDYYETCAEQLLCLFNYLRFVNLRVGSKARNAPNAYKNLIKQVSDCCRRFNKTIYSLLFVNTIR
jgi:hypothetical protein